MFRTGIHNLLHLRLELLIEVLHVGIPLFLALGNLIEVLLNLCREIIVHNLREVLH